MEDAKAPLAAQAAKGTAARQQVFQWTAMGPEDLD
jgi:hypothetical protein